jgi:hypothetical protein
MLIKITTCSSKWLYGPERLMRMLNTLCLFDFWTWGVVLAFGMPVYIEIITEKLPCALCSRMQVCN